MLCRLREKWSETEVVLLAKNPLPSLRKQPTFATPIMTSERRTQKFHTDDVSLPGSGSCVWLVRQIWRVVLSIRGFTTQICVVTRHHYGISALVPQTSLRVETSAGVAKCRLFCQAILHSAQRSRAHPAQPNHPLWSWPVTSKPGRVPLRVLGRGVPPGSPNPEPIFTRVFRL